MENKSNFSQFDDLYNPNLYIAQKLINNIGDKNTSIQNDIDEDYIECSKEIKLKNDIIDLNDTIQEDSQTSLVYKMELFNFKTQKNNSDIIKLKENSNENTNTNNINNIILKNTSQCNKEKSKSKYIASNYLNNNKNNNKRRRNGNNKSKSRSKSKSQISTFKSQNSLNKIEKITREDEIRKKYASKLEHYKVDVTCNLKILCHNSDDHKSFITKLTKEKNKKHLYLEKCHLINFLDNYEMSINWDIDDKIHRNIITYENPYICLRQKL